MENWRLLMIRHLRHLAEERRVGSLAVSMYAMFASDSSAAGVAVVRFIAISPVASQGLFAAPPYLTSFAEAGRNAKH
jgi:hypothetical protein